MAFSQGPELTKKGRNESFGLLKVLLVIPTVPLFVPLSPCHCWCAVLDLGDCTLMASALPWTHLLRREWCFSPFVSVSSPSWSWLTTMHHFEAQSAGRGLIKHFSVICKWAAPWGHVIVLYNCVSCSRLPLLTPTPLWHYLMHIQDLL